MSSVRYYSAAKAAGKGTEVDDDTIAGWPNQTEASALLGVNASTLLRSRLRLSDARAGAREKRLSPEDVLTAAMHFRRRPVRQVASGLIALAEEKCPEVHEAIASRIDAFLEGQPRRAVSAQELLGDLQEALPTKLYRQVEAVYKAGMPIDDHASPPSLSRKAAGDTPKKREIPA